MERAVGIDENIDPTPRDHGIGAVAAQGAAAEAVGAPCRRVEVAPGDADIVSISDRKPGEPCPKTP